VTPSPDPPVPASWAGFGPAEAIFFDLDDTLLEDNPATERCWTATLAEFAALPAGLREEIRAVGQWFWSDAARHRAGRADLHAATVQIVREALAALGCADERLARAIAARYRALRDASMRLHDGAVETLAALARRGHRLGLITNGAALAQRRKLERFALASHFEYIGIEGEVGVGKPEPAAYERALDALAVAPRRAWMVGDNLVWDVQGAQRAGLRAIWVDYRRTGLPPDPPALPDHVVHAVSELAPPPA